jgi:hypothetical protein
MAAMRLLLILLAAVLLAPVALAAKKPDPRLAYLQKTLKTDMVKTFKKQAPKLKLTTIKCVLPKDGVTSHCKASFTDAGVKGYYPVTAKLHDVGTLTWVAKSPQCWNPAKKKYVSCG